MNIIVKLHLNDINVIEGNSIVLSDGSRAIIIIDSCYGNKVIYLTDDDKLEYINKGDIYNEGIIKIDSKLLYLYLRNGDILYFRSHCGKAYFGEYKDSNDKILSLKNWITVEENGEVFHDKNNECFCILLSSIEIIYRMK